MNGSVYDVPFSPLSQPKDADTILKELDGYMKEMGELNIIEKELERDLKHVRDKKSRIDRECSILSTWYVLISRLGRS